MAFCWNAELSCNARMEWMAKWVRKCSFMHLQATKQCGWMIFFFFFSFKVFQILMVTWLFTHKENFACILCFLATFQVLLIPSPCAKGLVELLKRSEAWIFRFMDWIRTSIIRPCHENKGHFLIFLEMQKQSSLKWRQGLALLCHPRSGTDPSTPAYDSCYPSALLLRELP